MSAAVAMESCSKKTYSTKRGVRDKRVSLIKRNEATIQELHRPPGDLVGGRKKWILAGAGPSLEEEYPAIESYLRQGFSLASVDMAFEALAARGLIPDLVFSCETMPYPFFPRALSAPWGRQKRVGAVVAAKSHPYQIAQLRGAGIQDFCFYFWSSEREQERGELNLPVLPPGGNVFNAMLVFLGGIRGGEVALFGNDLSFTGARFYTRGAPHEFHTHLKVGRLNTFEGRYFDIQKDRAKPLHGARGAARYTTPAFEEYYRWQRGYIEALLKSGHVKIGAQRERLLE